MPSRPNGRSSPPDFPPDRSAPPGGLAVWDLAAPGALARYRRLFEEAERRVHAFVEEPDRWERLEVEAEALRARWPQAAGSDASARPPLFGVPVGVKDVFHVRGLPTRAGSRLPLAALESADLAREAESVRRLRAAGALILGKTAATELAYFEPGPTENPRAPGHTPGGSSSGSAAAVAAGLCPLALGTQTIGSICRPAAYCGVVGFKPTSERIPRNGLIPLAPSLDHVGVLAADVAWALRGAAVLCDGWREDRAATTGPDACRPLLAVPAGAYLDALEPAGRDGFAAARERLVEAGWTVREVPALAELPELTAAHRVILAAEMAAAHGERLDRHPGALRPRTVELIEHGRAVAPAAVAAAQGRRRLVQKTLAALMEREGVGLWLSPAAPGPPPLGLASTGDPVMNLPWTFAGLPTVAFPAGATPDDLPLAVQLTGRAGADEAALGWAAQIADALAPEADGAAGAGTGADEGRGARR